MRAKLIWVPVITAMALFLPGILLSAEPSTFSAEDSSLPVLTVRGSGEVSAVPDRAIVLMGVEARSEKAADAQSQASRTVKAILDAIEETGVPRKNMTTARLNLSPEIEKVRQGHSVSSAVSRIIGYRASNVVHIDIERINLIGPVIDAAIAAGANRLENLSFGLKDDAQLQLAALRQAMANARQKAQAMAETLDLRLGRIIGITEEGVHSIRPLVHMQRMGSVASETATPVEPGRIRVTAAVVVTFHIEGSQSKSFDD